MSGRNALAGSAELPLTIVGPPFAIGVYIHDRCRERQNDEEEIFLRLSDEYADFMRLVIDNAGLHRLSPAAKDPFSEEQQQRKQALFAILMSRFERAYVLVHADDMGRQQARLWQSWEGYMTAWCQREDFRAALPSLLHGEAPGFMATIRRSAVTSAGKPGQAVVWAGRG